MATERLLEQLLGLPEFEIMDFQQTTDEMFFFLAVKDAPRVCIQCGIISPKLVIQKTRTQSWKSHKKELAAQISKDLVIEMMHKYKVAPEEVAKNYGQFFDVVSEKLK